MQLVRPPRLHKQRPAFKAASSYRRGNVACSAARQAALRQSQDRHHGFGLRQTAGKHRAFAIADCVHGEESIDRVSIALEKCQPHAACRMKIRFAKVARMAATMVSFSGGAMTVLWTCTEGQ